MYLYSKADYDGLRSTLADTRWNVVYDNIESMWQKWKEVLLEAVR